MSLRAAIGSLGRRKLIWMIVLVVVVVFLATLPLFYDVHNGQFGVFLFLVFIYGIVAQGWNLVAGYTGQISLGQNAFFGLGAYTMALLWFWDVTKTGYYFDPLLLILSAVTPAILAVLIGVPLLSRLRGDYFAFGTLGMGMIVTVLFLNGGDFTGGAEGKLLIKKMPEDVVFNLRTHYWVALLVAVVATLVVYFMTTSRVGLALKAIREDEVSAASHGVPVLRYKVIAFAVAAAMAGVAGAVYGYYLLQVTPSNVLTQNWLFYPILMVVLGGTGTILGPWIGALLIYAMAWYSDLYIPGYHPIFSGVIIILVMLFLPAGLMGLADKVPGRRSKGSAAP
jgi:branched-chain amino acid transport system permease protein